MVCLAHIQITLEKKAILDPLFDTSDTLGAIEVVGGTVPGDTILVHMIACMY